MLRELHIKNYALVDSLSVEFSNGLTVMTGETGAGKSIIIGALGLVLGDKGNTSVVRTGAEEASVTAVVHIEGRKDLEGWLRERDISIDDDDLIIRRTIKSNGRGSCYVNGVPVPRADIADLSAGLFDLHSQHQHQALFNKNHHRNVLDNYGGLAGRVKDFSEGFSRLQAGKAELAELIALDEKALGESEELARAISDIDAAELSAEELEKLEAERKILSQSERLGDFLKTAIDNGDLLSQIQIQREALSRASGIDAELEKLSERLESSYFEYQDIQECLKDYRRNMNYSPQRFEEVETRLAGIKRLQKKYGPGIEDVLVYRVTAAEKLDRLEKRDDRIETLKRELSQMEAEVLQEARGISVQRKKAAMDLQARIQGILQPLGMGKAQFVVSVSDRENAQGALSCGPSGMDVVEFLMSANQGEGMKPLRMIASGGELSRVMLAIKTILAESDNVATMVFDEIDTGIGGEVALAVGRHLSDLGKVSQILCITHLASIAARGEKHLQVQKKTADNRTVTGIRELQGEERIQEIARMLSGDPESDASLEHARELVNQYR